MEVLAGCGSRTCSSLDHYWMGVGLDHQLLGYSIYVQYERSILFANHKANGVVTNIGLLANTVDDTGSYMAG